MVDYAIEIGLKGMFITEHDNLSGIVKINKKQKELRKKGINFTLGYGNEIYLLPDWDPEDNSPRRYYHLVLLAKDKIGYQAIIDLSTRAWHRSRFVRNKRRVVTLYQDLLDVITPEVKGHIVCSTACLGGQAAQLFMADKVDEGYQFLEFLLSMFGYDDFYLEMQSSAQPEQEKWNKIIAEIPDFKMIITTDSHFSRKADLDHLEAFLRSSNESREVKEFYDGAYIQTTEEIKKYLHYLPEEFIDQCLDNTNKIAEQVEFFDISQPTYMPKVNVPKIDWHGPSTSEFTAISKLLTSGDIQSEYCITTCLNKLLELDKWNKEYLDWLEEECDVLLFQEKELGMNFCQYFNHMKDKIDLAWSVDCAIGPGRGSSGGSLICYLMELTQLNPIERKLYSWRFLNKERASLVDLDTDFDPVRKPALLEKIRELDGELSVTQMATFKTLTLKAAIGNACRGYRSKEFPNGIDADISIYLNGLVQVVRGKVASLQQCIDGDDVRGFDKNKALINEINKYPGLIDIIAKFEGLITNSSTHAAAVVFFDADDPITKHCSLMRSPNGDLCTALDLHDGEEVGMIKFD